MGRPAGKFEVFEDRLESLLVRWKKFAVQHPDKEKEAIQGCLQEINDGFTQGLMEQDDDGNYSGITPEGAPGHKY